MNITQEQDESKALQIQQEVDKIYDRYYKEDDEDIRRDIRKSWKQLIAEYEKLTGFNPYCKTL